MNPLIKSVKPFYRWYDLWLGAFADVPKRRLYLCCLGFGVVFEFNELRGTTTRLRLAYEALVDRASAEGNYTLNRVSRWFYTLKVILCLALRRRHFTNHRDEYITVSIFDISSWIGTDNNHWEVTMLLVGYGLFKGWWYDLEVEGE